MHSPRGPRLLRAVLSVAVLACLPLPSHALFGFGESKPQQPVGAVLAEVTGAVEYQPKDQGLAPAAARTALNPGDRVKTGPDGNAVVAFLDGTKLRLGSNAFFTLDTLAAKKVNVRLDIGVLEAWVKKMSGRKFNVRTPTAVAAIRGTEFRVEVEPTGETTWDLFGGGLQVSDNLGNQQSINEGERLIAEPDRGLSESKPQAIPPEVKMAPEPTVSAAQPAQTQPAQTQPAQTQPAQTQPTQGTQAPPPEEVPADSTQADQTTQPTQTTDQTTNNSSQEIQVTNQTSVSSSTP